MAKKSKKKKKDEKAIKIDSKTIDAIHIIPDQFHVSPKKNWGKLILLVGGVLVILIIVVGVAVFLNSRLQKENGEEANKNVNENVNTNVNTNINSNANTNENVNANTNTNINANTSANTNTDVNVNTNANTNINTNTSQTLPGQLPLGQDSDLDLLSNIEEQLYGSNVSRADTDSDTYRDGNEVKSGYSPVDAGKTMLEAGLATLYQNTNYNYQIIYPSNFVKSEVNNKRIFSLNTKTGSSIEIRIIDNSGNLSASDLYLTQIVGSKEQDLKAVNINNFNGVYDNQRLTYYLSDSKGTIYSILYRPGSRLTLDYLTTFEMIVNSFK